MVSEAGTKPGAWCRTTEADGGPAADGRVGFADRSSSDGLVQGTESKRNADSSCVSSNSLYSHEDCSVKHIPVVCYGGSSFSCIVVKVTVS